ncbi:MalY/PatB family protein [Clostridium peptidivorans]|uniref:MalY/PatB family protein n=1 Tax=Clostridium peptidivorans TaxID=100174 RepID=UPI000BE2EBDA|nr:MalY/PatB family protein [Clostridium peptidivorans]
MKYDFKTLVSRKGTGSEKWEQMYAWNPQVGDDVVPFSVADMELKSPPELIDGLKRFLDNAVLGYTMPYDGFYDAVIGWQKTKHNWNIKKEWIVNTPGVVDAFYAAMRAFTNPGDGVIIFKPVYYPFSMAIDDNERELVNCPLINTNGYYTIDYDKFDELAKEPKNKLLIFCSPHNPVGRVWNKEELERVAEIAIKNDLIVVSDEIWNDLIMPGYDHTVFATVNEQLNDRLITCTAPSKTFNLAGLAISNIIISNENLRKEFKKAIDVVRGGTVNILGYKACEIGYTKCEGWLEEVIKLVDTNQKVVKKFFEDNFPKIKAPLIEGTYLQWVDFNALKMTNKLLEKFMHMEAEFFLDEGYIFGIEGSGYERINLAAPTHVIEKALKRLEKVLKKVYK